MHIQSWTRNFSLHNNLTDVVEVDFGNQKHNDCIWGLPIYFRRGIAEPIVFFHNGLLLSCISLFGVLGNVLSAYVLKNKQKKSPLSILLIGLSSCDIVVCIVSFMWVGLPYTLWMLKSGEWVIKTLCSFYGGFSLLWTMGSSYFTIAISIERYIAVCWPLKTTKLLTYSRSRNLLLGIFLFSSLVQIPFVLQLLKHKPIPYYDHECDYGFGMRQIKTTAGKSNAFFWIAFLFLIPTTTVITLNVKIVRKIKEQEKQREVLTNYQAKKIKVTRMLLTIVAFFILCNFIRLINLVLYAAFHVTYAEQLTIPTLVIVFNSAVNYIIYCAFGKQFRQSFFDLICIGRFLYCRKPKLWSTNLELNNPSNSKTNIFEDKSSALACISYRLTLQDQ